MLGSPVGRALGATPWRREDLTDAHGDLLSPSGMEVDSINRRQVHASLSVSEDPVMRQGERQSSSSFVHHQWDRDAVFRRCRSLTEPILTPGGKKHIGRYLLEVTLGKHGRRKADALSLGDRPRRQDRCAENTRAHLGQSLHPSPDHRLFGERCRPKVAAADPHQRRMFLNAARLHTRSILTVIRCCKRPAHQVFLITWLVINSSRNQYFITIKAVRL